MITNQMKSQNKLELSMLVVKFIKHSQSPKLLMKTNQEFTVTSYYMVLIESFLDDFLFQEHLEILKQKDWNMEVTQKLLLQHLT